MEESAEIHSQALDKALGVQLNRRRRDYMSKGESRSISRKRQRQLTKQTFDGQLGNTHEANLDPLNVWNLSSGTMIYPWSMKCLFGTHYLCWNASLSLDAGERSMVLPQPDKADFAHFPGPYHF